MQTPVTCTPAVPADADALIVVAGPGATLPSDLAAAVGAAAAADRRVGTQARLILTGAAPGRRLVLAPTGPLDRDHDDVRRVGDAAAAAMAIALAAGARAPALQVVGAAPGEVFRHAVAVAVLGALGAAWEPLEAREHDPSLDRRLDHLHVVVDDADADEVRVAAALEAGRWLSRDLGGTEPERMAPARFAAHCVAAFADLPVTVEVVDDGAVLARDYPLLSAVARASLPVPRHRPCVVRLTYTGAGPVERTWLLAGKGVTYDTGGADLKTDGHMAGMSRDKGGAASVAGFVLAVARLGLPRVRVVAELGLVRNSIGADCFVTDEIIASHAGVRVRIGNTDAEGRLVLADLLSHLREAALGASEPHLFSVATLTGHSVIAAGPYTCVLDNGPARAAGMARALEATGDAWGDPVCVSRLRREDWHFVRARSPAEDVLSCNSAPSSRTPRGHQFPMAFLATASGLADHGSSTTAPLRYTHVDIGGAYCTDLDWQHGRPTGAPVVLLAAHLRG